MGGKCSKKHNRESCTKLEKSNSEAWKYDPIILLITSYLKLGTKIFFKEGLIGNRRSRVGIFAKLSLQVPPTS